MFSTTGRGYPPTPDTGMPAPEQDRQKYHEERVRPQIGRDCEIGIKGGRTHPLLEPCQIGRFLPDHGQYLLSRPVTP